VGTSLLLSFRLGLLSTAGLAGIRAKKKKDQAQVKNQKDQNRLTEKIGLSSATANSTPAGLRCEKTQYAQLGTEVRRFSLMGSSFSCMMFREPGRRESISQKGFKKTPVMNFTVRGRGLRSHKTVWGAPNEHRGAEGTGDDRKRNKESRKWKKKIWPNDYPHAQRGCHRLMYRAQGTTAGQGEKTQEPKGHLRRFFGNTGGRSKMAKECVKLNKLIKNINSSFSQ